jgi:hypothetical protein
MIYYTIDTNLLITVHSGLIPHDYGAYRISSTMRIVLLDYLVIT